MKLYLTKYAHQKLRYYVEQCEPEISGMGKVIVQKVEGGGKIFVVTDLQIFEQEVTAAHSTIDDDALAKFLFGLTKAGEDLSTWKLWWHSHAKMESFFSSTDTGTIDKSTEFPYLVSLVTNHRDQKVARIDMFDPFRSHSAMDVVVLEEDNLELKTLCADEIKEKVKTFRPSVSESFRQHYQGSQSHQSTDRKNIRTWDSLEDLDEELGFSKQLPPPKSASRGKGKYLTRKERKRLRRLLDSGTSVPKPPSPSQD